MQRIIFVLSLALSLVYGDRPCTLKETTRKIYTKYYPYNVVIKKYLIDDNCGVRKTSIDIFQNNKRIDILTALYGVDLLSDKDINSDGKLEIVISAHSGGHGTDTHKIGVIEPNMKKLYSFEGYNIYLQDINHDNSFEIIQPESVFFCISSEFCSYTTALSINLAYDFKNYDLVMNQEAMNILKKDIKTTCDTNVIIKEGSLEFSDDNCVKNNLISIAYNIYTKDIKRLRNIFNYFHFDSNLTKEKLMHDIFNNYSDYLSSEDITYIKKGL